MSFTVSNALLLKTEIESLVHHRQGARSFHDEREIFINTSDLTISEMEDIKRAALSLNDKKQYAPLTRSCGRARATLTNLFRTSRRFTKRYRLFSRLISSMGGSMCVATMASSIQS
jgi:hypothetical protein